MITMGAGEQIHLVIRRHWYALFRHAITLAILIFLPLILFSAAEEFGVIAKDGFYPLIGLVFTLYLTALLLYAFVIWTDYYLDVWIITNKRLVDIEQRGLFSRTISELPMANVQNVTIEIHGFIATVLRFGNIKVETASESSFIIREIPHAYQAKDIILKFAKENSHGSYATPGHQQQSNSLASPTK